MLFLVFGFCNLCSAQAQSIAEFQAVRFAWVQHDMDACLNKGCEGLSGKQRDECQIVEQVTTQGNCLHEGWNDEQKKWCLEKRFPFVPRMIRSDAAFAAYQELAAAVSVEEGFIAVAKTYYYKDPGYCSAVADNKLAFSICQAISSPKGGKVCLENLGGDDAAQKECVGAAAFINAMRTGDKNACTAIQNYSAKFSCQAFLADSVRERKEIAKKFIEDSCYLKFAPRLAVVGILDLEGPADSASYCDKIVDKDGFNLPRYEKCKRLVEEARSFKSQSQISSPSGN